MEFYFVSLVFCLYALVFNFLFLWVVCMFLEVLFVPFCVLFKRERRDVERGGEEDLGGLTRREKYVQNMSYENYFFFNKKDERTKTLK